MDAFWHPQDNRRRKLKSGNHPSRLNSQKENPSAERQTGLIR